MASTRKEVSEKHRKAAADIMDQACLPVALVKNGVDKCLRINIAAALAKVERDTFKRAAEIVAAEIELAKAFGPHHVPVLSSVRKAILSEVGEA